ncbi:ribonuclease III [Candidatus Magnetoovum chiemensis]|nr:ribonuclease III [Candidatus Magnetoovum chiemensis]
MLEDELNYTFNNSALLEEALTHRSFYHEYHDKNINYNERAEFLGDAVLGLIIAEHLFNNRQILTESEMSRLKAYLVSRKTLYSIACEIKLGSHLKLGKGEELTGGRKKVSLLANSLEAIFGAVFLDGGYDAARKTIIGLYAAILEEVLSEDFSYDFKTELQEKTQKLFATLPEYKLSKETGNDHDKNFTYNVYINGEFMGSGTGKNKKTAQANAAKVSLETLKHKLDTKI